MKTRIVNRSKPTPMRRRLMVLGVLAWSIHAPVMAKPVKPAKAPTKMDAAAFAPVAGEHYRQTGRASWYGGEFHGRRTANGETFDRHDFTAAHRTLPFGTVLRVTNLRNGRSILVRVNDRGPYVGTRVIDLSYAAAKEIGMTHRGVARVRVEAVEPTKLARDEHQKKG